jgi:hypothetical protein
MASEGSQEVSSEFLCKLSHHFKVTYHAKQLPKNPNPLTPLATPPQQRKPKLSPSFLLYQLAHQAVHDPKSPLPHLPPPPLLLE